jgi:hypothetical protein
MANLDYISHQTLCDGNGVPYAGAKIYYYETGTTTPKNTYSNAGLTSANTNPVVCDSNGVVPTVYLIAGRYKRTVTTSAGASLSRFDVDPLDASLEMITAASAPSPTYPFMRHYNTTDGHTYRRNSSNSAWIDEGLVDGLLASASVTDVLTGTDTSKAVTPDALAGLWQRGTDIASAATLSLPATGGGVFNITGTTGVSGISSAQGGRSIKLRFAGALTLTHNGTSFILPGAANITTVAGDAAEFINEAAADASGSNWRCFNYEPVDGRVLVSATQAQQEAATSAVFPVTPSVQHFHTSAAKCWASISVSGGVPTLDTNYNITSIADTAVGRCTVTIATDFSSANWAGLEATGGSAATGDHPTVTAKAAGSIELRNYREGAGGALSDPTEYDFVGFGDQ